MDDDGKTRWRPGLWGWILIVTGIVGVAVVITAFWIRTTWDLEEQRRRAAALGLPMTWAALGLDQPASGDAEIIHLAARHAERARQYEAGTITEPFTPVPPEYSCWQLAGGSGVDRDIDQQLDRLSGTPSLSVDASDMRGVVERGDAQRLWEQLRDERDDLRYVLQNRITAGVDDPVALAMRIRRLAGSQSRPVVWAQFMSVNLAGIWANQVQRRREDLDGRQVASEARTLADQLDATLLVVVASHPLYQDATLSMPAFPLLRAGNIRLPAVMVVGECVFLDLFFRLGRGSILERAITTADWCQRHGMPHTCAEVLAAAPSRPRPTPMSSPRELLSTMLDPGWCQHCARAGQWSSTLHMVIMEQLRTTTRLRLIAADLLGEPWPVDPGDPAGGRLREIRRGDHMIGAYSIGPNGVDDGGDLRTDWCWPLREQLGPRKASDTPYAP